MLQQTQVATVIPYWERWMRALPDLRSLARAKPERVLKLWEGLGYYRRARNLQAAAKLILEQHEGRFPDTPEALETLPGVGRYTAGAIASIAFNRPAPILDGNIVRVLTRLHGIRQRPDRGPVLRRLWNLSLELVQEAGRLQRTDKPGRTAPPLCSHLNQSLMELGALICTPRNPKCDECPLRAHCVALERGLVTRIPNVGPRQAAVPRRYVALVVLRNHRCLVRQRSTEDVNGGFWEFPNIELAETESDTPGPEAAGRFARETLGIVAADLRRLGRVRHSITRYRIQLEAYAASATSGRFPESALRTLRWKSLDALARLPLATLHKKILPLIPHARGPGQAIQ